VRISIENEELNGLVTESLEATGLRAPINNPPELVIHQSDSVPAGKDVWGLRWLPAPKEPERYTGPFVIDANHPLTRGLSLPGIVWGAHPGATNTPGYRPVITAGNTSLLTHRPTNHPALCSRPLHPAHHSTLAGTLLEFARLANTVSTRSARNQPPTGHRCALPTCRRKGHPQNPRWQNPTTQCPR